MIVFGIDHDLAVGLNTLTRIAEYTTLPIIVVSSITEPDVLTRIKTAGAWQNLSLVNLREELVTATKKWQPLGQVSPVQGTMVVVTGALGGLGMTTLAANLAFSLGKQFPEGVVITELSGDVPQLALQLDLKPRHDLESVTCAWERLDAKLLRQALISHPDQISILAQPPKSLQPFRIQKTALHNLMLLLRNMFEYSIFDIGHRVDETQELLVAHADAILVVVRLDVPAIHRTRQLLEHLYELGVGQDKIQIVVNRYGQRHQYSWRKAQKFLGLPVVEWFPDDSCNVNRALKMAQPVLHIAPRSSLVKRIHKLAWHLNRRTA